MSKLKVTLNAENPSPFVQPFLVLRFREKEKGHEIFWHIDVGGEIDKYLYIEGDVCAEVVEGSTILKGGIIFMKPLLEKLIGELANSGLHVERVGSYVGSAGPSHIMRQGAIFKRISN